MQLKIPIKSIGLKILEFIEQKGTSQRMTLPKTTFIILTLFINCSIAKATTYYVDNAGNNINNGTSPDSAWQTLGKVNSYKFSPGDSILFKRGGIWRETLIISSSGSKGNNIVFSTYGTGNKPILSGADIYSSWIKDAGNYYGTVSVIPKYVFDNSTLLSPVSSKSLLTSANFYFDTTNTRVYVNYNPAGHTMEVSQRDNDISVSNKNYITIDGLQLQGGNYAGIKGQGSVNINNCTIRYNCSFGIFLHSNFLPSIISNNTVDHISGHGIEVYDSQFDIYGNTIDSIGIFHDAVKPFNWDPAGINLSVTDSSDVHNNTISWVLSGGDNQNHGIYIADNSTNINVYDNKVHDNWHGDGIKFATNGNIYGNICFNNGAAGIGCHNNTNYTMNVSVHNNLCYNNKQGGFNEYGMIQPVNLNIYNNTFYKNGTSRGELFIGENVTSAFIKNNIFFSNNNSVGLNAYGIQDNLVMSNNLYFNDSTSYVVNFGGGNKTLLQWQVMGYDANSLNADPLISNSDFHISSTFSPAIQSGVDIYSGNPIDIGAYPYNQTPKGNAGPDQTTTLPNNSVNLLGTGTDPDGTISSYSWTKISGPSSGTINNSNAASATVINLSEGVYQFELKVADDKGAIGKDTVQITVNAAPNMPPTANAGKDQTITLPANSVSFSGNGTDADGTISSYAWTKISGPSGEIINNANSASAIANNLSEGVYQFELQVTDDKGAVGKDTVQITVNAAPNMPPTANAGKDQTITLPTNTVSLSGNGTDADGTISSYAWTKISGPSGETINSANSASSIVNNLSEGVYQFELTVTDDKGATGKDTVQVTVNAAANISPTANAGGNQKITLPTNTITLNGSGTDTDGMVSGYSWTKISGPSSGTINNANSASAIVNNLSEGVYQFELTVTDDKGAVGKDTIQITVNPAANISPTANAGGDKTITLPTNTVSLSGNGTDPDGTIFSYAWTKISGPSAYSISSSSSASTRVSELVQGVYEFELKITDDKGAIGKDTVQITVNAAPNMPPTANAGADKTITLPINSVSLSGSGIRF